MSAPSYSQLHPADGASDCDLSGVEIVWTPEGADPLDLTGFEIERGGTLYPVVITALGSGVYKAFADIGLFPEEQSTEITFRASSLSAAQTEVSITISTRIGTLESAAAEFTGEQVIACNAHMELRAGHEAQFPGGTLAFYVLQHFAAHEKVTLLAEHFIGASDFAMARLNAARGFFEPLCFSALSCGFPATTSASNSLEVEGYSTAQAIESIRIEGDNFAHFDQSLEVGEEKIFPAQIALSVSGEKQQAQALSSVQIERGKGAQVLIDLTSDELSQSRA